MKRKLFPILLAVILIAGCAQISQFLGIAPKSFDEIWEGLTPKGKVALAFSIYNKQYEDYKIQAARKDLTEPEKQVLRQKKKILTEIYPLITTLDLSLAEGQPFNPAVEAALIGYLRQLAGKI